MNLKWIGQPEMQNGKLGKMQLQSIYHNKKVFVTGHTGFKGSWLISWLRSMGALLKGYALAPQQEGDLFNVINGDLICESVIADIRDKERLKKEILSFEPDFVFHLAAQPIVRYSYEAPLETFDVNVMGTAYLLDAIRFLNKPCVIVVITTDKVYFNKEENYFYKEDDKIGGYDPYSASKAAAEIVVDSYRSSFFNSKDYNKHQKSISSARAGNVIGGGDWAKDRIVPDIVRSLSKSETVIVRNPAAIRPWEHVLEPLHGYLVLAACQTSDPIKYATAYNFGPRMNEKLSVGELVKEAIKIWGEGGYETPIQIGAPHEANLLQLDITKAKIDLHWTPSFSVHQAIQYTMEWYKQFHQRKETAHNLIMNDIKRIIND
jgi:CDP-glucose 4,6-dehydratase